MKRRSDSQGGGTAAAEKSNILNSSAGAAAAGAAAAAAAAGGVAIAAAASTKKNRCFHVNITKYTAVAKWTWGTPSDEVCGICQSPFEGCAPGIKFPGDECPVVWGLCKHAFHLQCLSTWLQSKSTCPMCRREWWGSHSLNFSLSLYSSFLTQLFFSPLFLIFFSSSSSSSSPREFAPTA
jgi:anaphase-promoting complex subunit 11